MGSESSANSSDLLDLTPATATWSDPALVVGQSFNDPDAGVTITTAWATATQAAVSVTLGPRPACWPTRRWPSRPRRASRSRQGPP